MKLSKRDDKLRLQLLKEEKKLSKKQPIRWYKQKYRPKINFAQTKAKEKEIKELFKR